jgi:hypothetical protein
MDVEGMVVTSTLRVSYESQDGRHDLSLALDMKDLIQLKAQCDRAISKSRAVRSKLKVSLGKPCLIPGDSEQSNV